ncbi:MAG TPA: hypothetical protein VMW56_30810 [Candidatus Margulisiibacteriota bacterium]|nr:hypothetical protein [Candidatus Margulisiibacteriota bacterium]
MVPRFYIMVAMWLAAQISTAAADSLTYEEGLTGERRIQSQINSRLPRYTFVLQFGESAMVEEIRIFRGNGQSPVQLLRPECTEAPFRGSKYFQVVDLNGDGYRDISLLSWWGVQGNEGSNIWLFDPPTGTFKYDSQLSEEINVQPVLGKPCVKTFSKGGWQNENYSESKLCYRRAGWIKVWEHQRVREDAEQFVERTFELRGGKWVRTREAHVRDEE